MNTEIDSYTKQDNSISINFWTGYLKNYETMASLNGDNSSFNDFIYENISISLDSKFVAGVNEIAIQNDVTPNVLLALIWGIFLQRYTNSDDVVFGQVLETAPISDSLISNIVPIRVALSENETFTELLKKFNSLAIESQKHEIIQLDEILKCSELKQDLFNNLINFNKDISLDLINNPNKQYNFMLTMYEDDMFRLRADYNSFTFTRSFVVAALEHYKGILQEVINNPNIVVDDINFLSKEEKNKILVDFNNTKADYLRDRAIHQSFEDQVRSTPDKIALNLNGKEITYNELNKKANKIATILREKGITRNTIVGLMTMRNFEMIAGLLGILKSGGAYLPIDPEYPHNRIEYMLEDSNAKFLVTQKALIKDLSFEGDVICLDGEIHAEDNDIASINDSNDMAYIIYTSGSTGKPKGVMIEHRGVQNLIKGMTNKIDFSQSKSILALTTLSFDIFVIEVVLALLKGLKIIIADELHQTDSRLLGSLIKENGVNIIQTTPSRLRVIFDDPQNTDCFDSLTEVLVGGEAVPQVLTELIKKTCKAKVYNVYGPTETTVWSTLADLTNEVKVHIGKPISNTQIYILDSRKRLLPIGIPGELYIGGDGVARGYLNRDELTNERFVCHSLNSENLRIYRTGDLAKWLDNGDIECLGRVDHQVKIRGYRIEIGEIESWLLKYKNVREAAVIDWNDSKNNKYLCAYLVNDDQIDVSDIRKFLLESLPEYMIPTYFIKLDKIPLTPNKKIDRKALPDPSVASISTSLSQNYKPFRNDLEKNLVNIWQEVLDIPIIGIEDKFLELGGHSLKAMEIVSKSRRLGINLKLNDIFQYSQISEISEYLNSDNSICDNLIKDIEIASKLLSEEFNSKCSIVKCSVIEKEYLVLLIKKEKPTQLDDTLGFMKENFDVEILPHFIKFTEDGVIPTRFDESVFASFLDLKLLEGSQLENLYNQIEKMNIDFSSNILAGPPIDRYPIAPAQKFHMNSGKFELEGTVIKFDRYLNIEVLNKVLHSLIEDQGILRSCLVKAGAHSEDLNKGEENIYWTEYKSPASISVPFIDISEYDFKTREIIFNILIHKYFTMDFDLFSSIPYRMLLVKVNLKEWLLILPFSHLAYDGVSEDIIKSKILEHYDSFEKNTNSVHKDIEHYKDYVSLITKGPQDISDDEIYKFFALDRLSSGSNMIYSMIRKSVSKEPTVFDFRFNSEEHKILIQNTWKASFKLLCIFIREYYGVSEIPIWIMNYGRHYLNNEFFSTVGEFIDSIPVVVNTDDEMDALQEQVREKVALSSSKNINFYTLGFDDDVYNRFPNSAGIVAKQFKKPQIIFNFQGETEIDEKVIKDMLLTMKDFHTDILMFSVWHNADSIILRVIIPYEVNKDKLKSVLELGFNEILETPKI